MLKYALLVVCGLLLAACETCSPPNANLNVGIGTGGGVHTGVSVGQRCGPGYFAIGTGGAGVHLRL